LPVSAEKATSSPPRERSSWLGRLRSFPTSWSARGPKNRVTERSLIDRLMASLIYTGIPGLELERRQQRASKGAEN
jgi:hypothetical protein